MRPRPVGCTATGRRSRASRDDAFDTLVCDLLARSSQFARLWTSHEVGEARRGPIRLNHPEIGSVEFAVEALILPDRSDRRSVTYLPADETTAAALHRLLDGPPAATARARLRAV
jgi:hypothetical protein